MSRGDYRDFEVQVAPNTSGDLEVQILVSPRDRPRARFEVPCTQAEALDLLGSLEQLIHDDMTEAEVDRHRISGLAKIGERCFRSLFPANLRETLDESLEGSSEDGLRLRLSFDPREDDLASVAALPWETLFHPGRRQFLARRKDLAMLRYLDVPLVVRRFFVSPPLRVLLVAPTPIDGKASNVLEEQQAVFEALEDVDVEVRCVEQPVTLDRLIEYLDERETHVLHFMGHGGLHRETGQSGVFFEDRDRKKDCVLGRDLARRLEPFFRSLRLVVLNSCYGAAGKRRPNQEAFGAVSSALIARGLTAVVGMQFLISNDAAKCFSTAFYTKLSETGHVETAAAHARRQLVERDSESPEWITPVVLTRAADGRLFDPSSPPSPDEPLRIGIRSIFGWGVALEEWSHAFLPLTSFFRGRYLDKGERWQQEIYPCLATFLKKAVASRPEIYLNFAAHQSIAFAAGYLLDVQAGIQMTVSQRTAGKTVDWRLDDSPDPGAWTWEVHENELDSEQKDIALAISPTRSTQTSVESYIKKRGLRVANILEFKPPAGPSTMSVVNGRHAFQLAEAISNKIYQLTPGDWPGMFHLFYAGPNGLLFFLGRLSRGPRRIQLYEYDFDGRGTKTYMPSLVFPPPEVSEP